MKKIMAVMSNFMEITTVLCFLLLAALIFFQIGGRWFGMQNIGWTDEMISCFTTWMVFLGLAYMCERDGHIKITMLQDALSARKKAVLLVIVRVVNIACGAAVAYSGYGWTQSTATKVTSSLQISYNIWYSSVLICSLLFTIFAIAKLYETIVSL